MYHLAPRKKVVDIPLDDEDASSPLPEQKEKPSLLDKLKGKEPVAVSESEEMPKEKQVLEELIQKAQKEAAPAPILQPDNNDQFRIPTDGLSTAQYVYPPISLLKLPRSVCRHGHQRRAESQCRPPGGHSENFGVQTRIIDISRGPDSHKI